MKSKTKALFILPIGQHMNKVIYEYASKYGSPSGTDGVKKEIGGKEVSVWEMSDAMKEAISNSPDYIRTRDYELYVDVKDKGLRKLPKSSNLKSLLKKEISPEQKKKRFTKLKRKISRVS